MFEIMIDTGGTFADGVLMDENQEVSTSKSETDPENPARSIMNCISLLAQDRELTYR